MGGEKTSLINENEIQSRGENLGQKERGARVFHARLGVKGNSQ